jgi:hypothetical protein
MRPPPLRITTMTVEVVHRGSNAFLLGRDGKLLCRGVLPSRVGPLSDAVRERVLWRESMLIGLNRLRAEAVHCRHRSPWHAKTYVMKCLFLSRARSKARQRYAGDRRRRLPPPASWPDAAKRMVGNLYGDAYRERDRSVWGRWAVRKTTSGTNRSFKCPR